MPLLDDTDENPALRAILRIKAGLSPFGRVSGLTVDLARQLRFLKHACAPAEINQPPAVVVGPYGAGKTHFLQLTKEYALDNGFAFGQLSQDTGFASLAHPQRHVSTLIKSFTAPSPYGNLLDWIGNYVESPRNVQEFSRILQEIRHFDFEHANIVDTLLHALRLPTEHRSTAVVTLLSGIQLAGKTIHPSVRIKAYGLVRFWLRLSQRIFQCQGLVLLIDELENLFSNAVCWNILSRRAAYRALSFYASGLSRVAMICTLTPDGYARLAAEIKQQRNFLLDSTSHLAAEDIQGFLDAMLAARPYELTPMEPRDYALLGERLRTLHAEARGYKASLDLRFPEHSAGMTPRIFSKSVISLLESAWFHSTLIQ